MTTQSRGFGFSIDPEALLAILRMTLGAIFIVGGIKLAFLGETGALVASYTNPDKGWLSPVFADKITQTLGVSIGFFLRSQGLIEIGLGALMILGLGIRVVAVLMGLLFWSFSVANPVVGEIRLSRDIALMGLCFAVACARSGAWSLDWSRGASTPMSSQRQDGVLLVIRLSLAYTLLASAIFASGPFSNHLNNTLPLLIVFLMGALLVAGVQPHWIMSVLAVWMLYVVATSIMAKGFYFGLDSAKRELGFLAAAIAYACMGPDRWAWPRSQAVSHVSVSETAKAASDSS